MNTSNNEFYGVPQYLYYGQNERVDELNGRIESRQFSDTPLQPNYDPRPVSTKYAFFPLIDKKIPTNEPLKNYNNFEINNNFSPATRNAPFSGYANNVDAENNLRNQFFALKRGGIQGDFVPQSTSDLYMVSIVSNPTEQPHKQLFSKTQFDNKIHPNIMNSNIGKDVFFNNTRTQLRNS